mgnify:CR=1 FL=1|tara:strand:- start:1690 stop:2082 length:393 start_codon:yes stop_codon:yes gene_type:complete
MILISILLLSWTVSSQTDTNKVCLSHNIALKIAADLVSGDSAKAELQNLKHVYSLTQLRESKKDSIILQHEMKSILCIKQVDLQKDKVIIFQSVVDDLQKENRRLKNGIKILGISVGVTTLAALFLVIIN